MADLSTPAGIEAELAITADYDVTGDVDKARRRVAALRRKLDFPETTAGERGANQMTFAMQMIENQIKQALAWLADRDPTLAADPACNPAVVHADFSGLRGSYC